MADNILQRHHKDTSQACREVMEVHWNPREDTLPGRIEELRNILLGCNLRGVANALVEEFKHVMSS